MVRVIEKKSRLLSKNYEELKRIEPNSMSLEFGTWISEIYLCCNEFYPTFKEEIPFAKTEEQLLRIYFQKSKSIFKFKCFYKNSS